MVKSMKKCDTCWGTGVDLDHCELGQHAKAARHSRFMLLREQAKALGISESFLCLLEAGKRKWTKDLYQKVMKV